MAKYGITEPTEDQHEELESEYIALDAQRNSILAKYGITEPTEDQHEELEVAYRALEEEHEDIMNQYNITPPTEQDMMAFEDALIELHDQYEMDFPEGDEILEDRERTNEFNQIIDQLEADNPDMSPEERQVLEEELERLAEHIDEEIMLEELSP